MKVSRLKTKYSFILSLAFVGSFLMVIWNHFNFDPVGLDTDHAYFGRLITEEHICPCLQKLQSQDQKLTDEENKRSTCSKVNSSSHLYI